MASATNSKREERAQDRAIERTIDETKDSTRKAILEVKREIPEFTSAFHDYQEQNIDTLKQMTSDFLESQKEVAKSIRSAISNGQTPMWSAAGMYSGFWPYSYWSYPQDAVEMFARFVSNSAENTIAATRLSNEMLLLSMEASHSSLRHAQSNSKAVSRYMVESANDLKNLPREKR